MSKSSKKKDTLFVKLSADTDEKIMADLLGERYEILTAREDLYNPGVDLVIVDHNVVEQSCCELLKAKESTEFTYLPLMVMIPNGMNGTDQMWEIADDVVEMPVNRKNFHTRVKGLIKIRTFARKAEMAHFKLERKNEQLRLYFNAIDATITGLIITDPNQEDNPIIFCNKAFSELTGYTREETLGRNCRFLQAGDRDQKAKKIIRVALENGEGCSTLLRNYRKDGTVFWNELKISPIKNDRGEIEYFVGIQNDMTSLIQIQEKLKVAKEQWQTIVDQNPNMVQISVDGIIKFMNDAGAEFHGFDKPVEMVGMSVYDLHPNTEHSSLDDRIEGLKKGESTAPRIYTTRDKQGKKRYIRTQSIPVMFKGKIAAQTVGEDVTHLKESEIELKNLLGQKQILLQEVHHRVKNNLAVLSALISMQVSDLENMEAISVLEDTQKRILSIAKVHELLYNQENLNEIGFDNYVKKLVSELEGSFDEGSEPPEFLLNIDPLNLSLDQAITCGLLLNELITNSIKYAYTSGEQIRIAIKIRTVGETVYINFRDYGKGLDNEKDFFKDGNFGSVVIQVLLNQLHADWELKSDGGFIFNLNFKLSEYHGPSRYLKEYLIQGEIAE